MPIRPKIIPKIIRFRIRSLRIIAERTRTIIGVETISTDAEMGEVKLNPLKNASIFKATPKKAAAENSRKIYGVNFFVRNFLDFLVKSQTNQNKIVAPPTRIMIKP